MANMKIIKNIIPILSLVICISLLSINAQALTSDVHKNILLSDMESPTNWIPNYIGTESVLIVFNQSSDISIGEWSIKSIDTILYRATSSTTATLKISICNVILAGEVVADKIILQTREYGATNFNVMPSDYVAKTSDVKSISFLPETISGNVNSYFGIEFTCDTDGNQFVMPLFYPSIDKQLAYSFISTVAEYGVLKFIPDYRAQPVMSVIGNTVNVVNPYAPDDDGDGIPDEIPDDTTPDDITDDVLTGEENFYNTLFNYGIPIILVAIIVIVIYYISLSKPKMKGKR